MSIIYHQQSLLSRPYHGSDPLDSRHGLFQTLQSLPLLHISLLQHLDPLFQFGPLPSLRRNHLVRLAEQLSRQILQLRLGLGQARLSP